MAQGNFVEVIGNVTRDPELRFTANGAQNCGFGIAVSRRWQNRQTNEWEEATSFFNVVCWGELADNVAESISKGARVIVGGRLEQRSWEDKDTNEKRSVVEIVADEVAPSLRWATAQVTRTQRSEGGGQQSRNNQSGGRQQAAPAGYDEDPF